MLRIVDGHGNAFCFLESIKPGKFELTVSWFEAETLTKNIAPRNRVRVTA